jgi:hypothetical protein
LTQEDPDDTPEYYRAKEEWIQFWKQVREGLDKGVDDDPNLAIARLAQEFGVPAIGAALEQYVENLPRNFELRWRERREARVCEEKEAQQRARNPKLAGRKHKRSDIVLLSVWLTVQRTMRHKGKTALEACKLLVKPPSRREASRWPGLLLYRDPHAGPYYVKTPANLRDIYNDAVKYYSAGPERLKRHWETQLETFLCLGSGV